MIQNLSSAMEADQDLHIAKHVEPESNDSTCYVARAE